MELIIALFFMTPLNFDIKPSYKVNHCYQAETTFRPNIIGIQSIEKTYYNYKIFYGYEIGWSEKAAKSSNFYTIEHVYEKEVKCP